jgi:hypothetical protein
MFVHQIVLLGVMFKGHCQSCVGFYVPSCCGGWRDCFVARLGLVSTMYPWHNPFLFLRCVLASCVIALNIPAQLSYYPYQTFYSFLSLYYFPQGFWSFIFLEVKPFYSLCVCVCGRERACVRVCVWGGGGGDNVS